MLTICWEDGRLNLKPAIFEMDSWARSTPSHPNFSVFSARDHVHQAAEPCSQMFGTCEKQPVNRGVFQYSALRSQQRFGMKRQGMLFKSSSLYRKENQLHLFIGDIISSLLSNGESLLPHEKLILPSTQTQDRHKKQPKSFWGGCHAEETQL